MYSEEAGVSLHIQSLKSGGSLLEKAICRCAIDRGCPSKVKNLNDLIMYTYATEYQAIIAVHNKVFYDVIILNLISGTIFGERGNFYMNRFSPHICDNCDLSFPGP